MEKNGARPGGTPEFAPRMMFGGEGSGVPPGTPWASVRYPELAATVNGPYGTRDPSLSYYPEKGNVPSVPGFSMALLPFA